MPKDKTLLSVDDILAVDDLKRETIDVPEWGGEVELQELTAEQRNFIGGYMIDRDGEPDFTRAARLQVMIATFGLGLDNKHFDAIGRKSSAVVERIADKVRAMSGLEKSAIEDAEDFLPASPNGDSPSD